MQQLVAASYSSSVYSKVSVLSTSCIIYTQHYSTVSISHPAIIDHQSLSNERKSFKPFLHTASIRMFLTWQSASDPMAIHTVNNTHTSLRPSSFITRVGIEAGHLSDMRIPTSPTSSESDNSPGSLFSPPSLLLPILSSRSERQLQTIPLPEVRSDQRASHQFCFANAAVLENQYLCLHWLIKADYYSTGMRTQLLINTDTADRTLDVG
jgi:hypothetical protein